MDCIFCKIIAGEIPADIVYKNDKVTAFKDVNPKAPTHILIVPNQHMDSLDAVIDDATANAAAACLRAAPEIAKSQKLNGGYRVVTNTGADAGQSVQHLHFHLMGGRQMGWSPA